MIRSLISPTVFLVLFCISVALKAQVEPVAQPNAGESTKSSYPYGLTAYNGKFLFGATDFKGGGLFITDGTEAGTYCVTHEAVPHYSYHYSPIRVFNGKVYFIGTDRINTLFLWETDGTSEGTRKVINFSELDAFPNWLGQCGEGCLG